MKIKILLIIIPVLAWQSLNAQPDIGLPANAPKIGLVLSGGGAKGMAHVGVLKVLDNLGIRPDYISGTSMGSLVGALYALGYSAAEMEVLLLQMDWGQVLTNTISLRNIPIEEKAYYGRYLVELPVDGYQVGLPGGAIEGQKLSELFCRLTAGAHDITSFDDLPIPFAAIAVDLPTGKPVVLDRGSLADAMRASMAIPSVFTPVKNDSSLLVDGGIVRNFPVQEVRNMGADIVIGIDVSDGFPEAKSINSLLDVMVHSSFIMSNLDTELQRKQVDILITPELGGYSAADFYSAEEIINRGYAAAMLQYDHLQMLTKSLDKTIPAGIDKRILKPLDAYRITRVSVEGNNRLSDAYVINKLAINTEQAILFSDLEEKIDNLYGTRYFSKVSYALYQRTDGYELQVKVQEAQDASLRPALHFDTENGAGFILSYVHRNVFSESSRLIAEADFAENPRATLNYLKYLGNRQWMAFSGGAEFLMHDLSEGFVNSQRISAEYRNTWLNPYLRLQTSTFRDLTVGAEVGWERASLRPTVNASQEIGDDLVFDLSQIRRFAYGSFQFEIFGNFNTLDQNVLPASGWKVDASAEVVRAVNMRPVYFEEYAHLRGGELDALFDFQNLLRFSLDARYYHPLTERWNLESGVNTMFTPSNSLSPYDRSLIGGFFPLFERSVPFWGAAPDEFNPNSFVMLREKGRFEIIPDLYAEGLVNLLLQDVRATTGDGNMAILGYGLGVNYQSLLGPIKLALAHRQNTNLWYGFFSLGYNFR